MRAEAEAKGKAGQGITPEEVKIIFGPGTGDNAADHAGALSTGDARILLFPVRSLAGVFAWVTSVDALARFQRETAMVKLDPDWKEITEPGKEEALVNGNVLKAGDSVVLEEFSFTPKQDKVTETIGAWLVEERRESDPDFLTIFGHAPQKGEDESVAQSGRAVFFDAAPARLPKLELDIMNPHYPKYYQGKEPPTDSQSPVPVYFLTVASGVEFRFAVGWRGPLDDEARQLRSLAQGWLIKGLTELGAGAKTSAGYGYFLAPRR